MLNLKKYQKLIKKRVLKIEKEKEIKIKKKIG